MICYSIKPCQNLSGEVNISGSKNAALPIIAATLLTEETSVIHNVPILSDVQNICDLLESSCVQTPIIKESHTLFITPGEKICKTIPIELAGRLRASFLIMGPMLARYKKVKIPLPGGCRIGSRPIDLHLKGFAAMGAVVKQGHGYVELKCSKLNPAKIYLDFPSVGATENLMLAASLIEGETVIENAATEPEIIDLSNFLKKMGAVIHGAGTDTIKILGKRKLNAAEHTVIPDRIEAGTFMTAAAVCKSSLKINNIIPEHLNPVTAKLTEMGFSVEESQNSITVLPGEKIKSVDIKTLPYPGFPTDMQAQFMSLMSVAEGTGVIIETIFENRFMHVPELLRMGANIKIDGRTAIIDGAKKLSGAKVRATDLRAGAALTVAALCARGESEIENIEHIERGYESFSEKLSGLGVEIKKFSKEN